MKTKVTIERPGGLWLINGKRYNECTFSEKMHFQLYISSYRNNEILKPAS